MPPATITASSTAWGVPCEDSAMPAQASASSAKPVGSIAFGLGMRVTMRPFRMLPMVMNTTSGVITTPASLGDMPKPPWNSSGA